MTQAPRPYPCFEELQAPGAVRPEHGATYEAAPPPSSLADMSRLLSDLHRRMVALEGSVEVVFLRHRDMESTIERIRDGVTRIVWLLLAAVLLGVAQWLGIDVGGLLK